MALMVWSVSNLVVGLICGSLIIVLLKYGSKKIHYIWALFNLSIALWGFGAFLVGMAKDSSTAFIFWMIAFIGSLPASTIFYHVIVVIGDLKRTKTLIVLYIYSLIFYLLSVFNLAGIRMEYIYNSLYYVRGTDYRLVLLVAIWVSIIILAVVESFRLFISSQGRMRRQYSYLLTGFIVGFFGGILNVLPFFGYNVFPIGNVFLCIYCVLVTYAILRHQLFDIEIIIKKTLVFAGIFACIYAVFSIFALLGQVFFDRFTSSRYISMIPSIIVVTLMLRPLENLLINATNKYLFQKKYNYKELLKTFTSEVLTVFNIDDLLNLTVDKLSDIIKLDSCAVLIFDNEKQHFAVRASRGIKDPGLTLVRSDSIIAFLKHTHGYILKKDLEDKKIFIPDDIRAIMDKLSSDFIIPMILHEKIIGILSLGKKKSDEDFTQDDMDILLPLARTLAIAISNAELFEELGKAQAEAAQKEKMAVIGTLSAGINHEICNPLGIARGQCEAFLLNMKDGLYVGKTPEELIRKAQDIMSKVIRETDRATAITKKLSSFAKPAKGEAELVDITKELDEVFGLVSYELKLDKIELKKNIDANLPHVMVDRKQFQEVLFNLLRNAGQAIGEKGTIVVTAKEADGKVSIDIADTGSGIAQDKIKELFNPFFTTKDPGKGTGLGLFIVRQIVEKNGGKIYMKNTKVGNGTTFTVEFPRLDNHTAKV